MKGSRLSGSFLEELYCLFGALRVLRHHSAMGENALELNLSLYFGLCFVFIMELLWSFFPPLLGMSKVAKQLTTIGLNPDCMEQSTID
jgi:hypothetical protein